MKTKNIYLFMILENEEEQQNNIFSYIIYLYLTDTKYSSFFVFVYHTIYTKNKIT